MRTLYVALGSNKGNRTVLLKRAIDSLSRTVGTLLKCSSFYETSPVGFKSKHFFINAVAAFSTDLSTTELLAKTQEIERELGRTHKSIDHHYKDRCIDIDLLMLDDVILSTDVLTLPHPEMHRRTFVLEPFAEIAPMTIHPLLKRTIKELAKQFQEEEVIK